MRGLTEIPLVMSDYSFIHCSIFEGMYQILNSSRRRCGFSLMVTVDMDVINLYIYILNIFTKNIMYIFFGQICIYFSKNIFPYFFSFFSRYGYEFIADDLRMRMWLFDASLLTH